MDAEKFLGKFFHKLTKNDFEEDTFLTGFYSFFKKAQSDDLFRCYIDYITRNQEFTDDNDKTTYLQELYSNIRDSILYKDEDETTDLAFVSEKERASSDARLGIDKHLSKKEVVRTTEKGPIKINKAKALNVLSSFIKSSNIVVCENPYDESTEQDGAFRDATTANILTEIQHDGIVMPEPRKDVEFGKRSDMMNVWRSTESKCSKLCEEPVLDKLISKMCLIDTKQFVDKPTSITTLAMKEINSILPVETFTANYSKAKYHTTVKLTNTIPIDEAFARSVKKNKILYICAGSQMVQGGNADQGINVQESMLYNTSTYSVGIAKALHAYPLSINHAILCPNVLIFKDSKYQDLPMNKYQRIAVLCAPNKWRPKLVNHKHKDLSDLSPADYIYDVQTTFESKEMYFDLAKSFSNTLEMALFFGYDTIVLDDRAIEDNNAPAHLMAKMMREVINVHNSRFNEIIIAVNKACVFNVFKYYFST